MFIRDEHGSKVRKGDGTGIRAAMARNEIRYSSYQCTALSSSTCSKGPERDDSCDALRIAYRFGGRIPIWRRGPIGSFPRGAYRDAGQGRFVDDHALPNPRGSKSPRLSRRRHPRDTWSAITGSADPPLHGGRVPP